MSKLFSIILLVILTPIFFFTSIIILISDGFPVFFRQKRIGVNNKTFFIYKFRSMKRNTPDIPTHLFRQDKVNYILFGPLLRKYSIDELPQLINILKGDMYFIGPRPALYIQNDLIELRTNAGVHKLKPGVTGWAQVNGRDELSIDEKVEMDYYYLKNKSIRLDCNILYLTFIKSIKADGVLL